MQKLMTAILMWLEQYKSIIGMNLLGMLDITVQQLLKDSKYAFFEQFA
jgi:hypothetical protein